MQHQPMRDGRPDGWPSLGLDSNQGPLPPATGPLPMTPKSDLSATPARDPARDTEQPAEVRPAAATPPLQPDAALNDVAPVPVALPASGPGPHAAPEGPGDTPGAAPPAPAPPAPAAEQKSVDRELLWTRLQDAVRARIQPEQFETWFRRAALLSADGGEVVLAVQNSFAASWLQSYYHEVLEQAVRTTLGHRADVRIEVDPELTFDLAPAPSAPDVAALQDGVDCVAPAQGPRDTTSTEGLRQGGGTGLLWNSDVVLNPKYTFDNFVVGPCNRLAHAASMGAGEAPGKAYNPFFLHGSVGLGKTHLLQSTCFSVLERWPETRILYLSCETFVNHFINALQDGDLAEFRNKYRNVDVLVVDDIHMLANKERTQEEFFHTFNTLYNAGKQIVLSSDSPPRDIPTLQERLVSRFKMGMVAEIELPCYETRTAIVKRKSRERGVPLSDEIAGMIAERIETNVRELEGAVTRLIGFATLTCQEITPDLARDALRDLFVVQRGQPTMDDIVRLVTEQFDVRVVDLQSKSRAASIVLPRQIAMYLARKVTRQSLGEIGGFFGGRDHSTVIYAVEKIGKLIESDHAVADIVEEHLSRLTGNRR